MSRKERMAVSQRMTQYWNDRRAQAGRQPPKGAAGSDAVDRSSSAAAGGPPGVI
jgi:hypothetical protein